MVGATVGQVTFDLNAAANTVYRTIPNYLASGIIAGAFYLVIVLGSRGVSAGESYKGFDKLGKKTVKITPIALKLLQEDDADNFLKVLKNDLYLSSAAIVPEIQNTAERLGEYGKALMTGSGSAVYGIYKTKKERDSAYEFLRIFYGDRILKAQTV